MAEIRAACRDRDGHDPLDEAAELHLKHQGLSGARLVLGGEHGFAVLLGGELSMAVHPDHRGRGIGAALAADVHDDTEAAWAHGDHPAATALAQRHGLRRARELWVMRRDLATPLPPLPPAQGVTVRGYRQADAEELLAVNAAAFAEHPEQGDLDAEGLAQRMAEPWFDAEGLLLATDDEGGRLLGFHWTKRHDPHLGEVYVVGVDPHAQGRGLGRLLTLAGLHHLDDGSTRQVLLYVESDNHPAVALYRGLGFTHAPEDTHVRWARA